MPNWKKVVVSGSNVSQLVNDGVYLRTIGDGVISSSAQIAAEISGAFTATSASLSGRIDNLSSSSTVFASTGSNTFKGDQTFSGSLLPETTEVFSLGSPDKVWESLYVDGQSIYMRDTATNTFVTMSANNGVLTFNNTRLNVPLGITSSNLILTSVANAGVNTGKFLVLDSNGNVDFRTEVEVRSDIGAQGLSAGTVSSSAQIQAYDIFLEKLGDNVISSSAQVDHNLTTNFVANEHIDHTTVSISAGSGLSGGGTIAATRTLALDTSSAHFTDGVKTKLNTEGVISSSAQLTGTFDTRYLNTIGDNVLSSSAQIAGEISGAFGEASGGFSSRITSLEAAGGTAFSSSVASRLTSVEGYTLDNVTDNGSTTTNGITVGGLTVNGNATITGTLTAQQFNTEYVSSSIIFESGSTKFGDSSDDVHSFTGSINLTGSANTYLTIKAASEPGLFLNTSDGNYDSLLFNGYGTLGLAYYQNDSGLANKSATTYPIYYYAGGSNANTAYTQFQVNGTNTVYFRKSGIEVGALTADVHSFTGSIKLNTQTAATTDTDKFLVFDTGGQIKYRTGAEVLSDINPGGLISSSAQLTTEFDTRYLNTTGDNVISSSAQLTTEFDTRYLNTTGDGVISSSAQIATEISGAFTQASGGFSTRITALEGGGYVDVGTGASGSRLAIWQDTNTIKGNANVVLYEQETPYFGTLGVWDDTAQDGIDSKTIITNGLFVGHLGAGTGGFTSSIALSANRGPLSWFVQTQLDSFNFASAPTNAVIHSFAGYSAFISYWVNGYQGYRTGQIVISSNGSNSAVHTEFSTVSIGNTSDVEFSVGMSGGLISLYLTAAGATEGTFEIKKFISV